MKLRSVILFPLIAISASALHVSAADPLKSGIDLQGMNTAIKPGDDFFSYANGNWIAKNPIPPDQSSWGVDQVLHLQNLKWLRESIEALSAPDAKLDADGRKIRDLYATATDEKKLEAQGTSALNDEFAQIAKINTIDDVIAMVGHQHVDNSDSLFSFGIGPDEKASSKYAVYLSQGGLGLPERGYYVDKEDDSKKMRDLYRKHVARMFELFGESVDAAGHDAESILNLETELAKVSRTPVQLRDVEAQYNKKSIDELKKLSPNINWDVYFKAISLPAVEAVIVGQPEFFERINALLKSTPIDQWKTYFRWRLMHQCAGYLNDTIVGENFKLYGTALSGVTEIQPRWKRGIRAVDSLMGEALGRLYVEKHFPPEARTRVRAMVQNIIDAYRDRILEVDWMAPETKQQAVGKLAVVLRKIGYPDHWHDYTNLQIGTDSYVQNMLNAQAFDFRFWMGKLKEPVDRTLWEMTPPTINAYYDPTLNEIVFPAGILQSPYFDPQAEDAVNYGSIGAVIGHELTHGFDDQGALFDATGNMKNWWTAADKKRFDAKGAAIVKEFDACVAIDNIHVNGKLTLGENIADLGGLVIAYNAYQKSLHDQPSPTLDGFTGDQRFFLGFAQSWRTSNRPEELKSRLRVDPHSPEQFRVNVPCSNVQAFYDAFGVSTEQKMFRAPGERVLVW
jgi:putative endopeptidase